MMAVRALEFYPPSFRIICPRCKLGHSSPHCPPRIFFSSVFLTSQKRAWIARSSGMPNRVLQYGHRMASRLLRSPFAIIFPPSNQNGAVLFPGVQLPPKRLPDKFLKCLFYNFSPFGEVVPICLLLQYSS